MVSWYLIERAWLLAYLGREQIADDMLRLMLAFDSSGKPALLRRSNRDGGRYTSEQFQRLMAHQT